MSVFLLSLLQKFLSDTKRLYEAELETVDFSNNADAARVNINTWVEKQTHGAKTVSSSFRKIKQNQLYCWWLITCLTTNNKHQIPAVWVCNHREDQGSAGRGRCGLADQTGAGERHLLQGQLGEKVQRGTHQRAAVQDQQGEFTRALLLVHTAFSYFRFCGISNDLFLCVRSCLVKHFTW